MMRDYCIRQPRRLVRVLCWLGYSEYDATFAIQAIRRWNTGGHKKRVARAVKLRKHVYRERGFTS